MDKAFTTLVGVVRIALGEEPCRHARITYGGPGLAVTCQDCGQGWS